MNCSGFAGTQSLSFVLGKGSQTKIRNVVNGIIIPTVAHQKSCHHFQFAGTHPSGSLYPSVILSIRISPCKCMDPGGSKGLRAPERRVSNLWRPETTFSMSESVGRRTGLERNDAGNWHHCNLEPSLAVSSSLRSDILRGFFSICPGGKYSRRGNCSSLPKTLTHQNKAPSTSKKQVLYYSNKYVLYFWVSTNYILGFSALFYSSIWLMY